MPPAATLNHAEGPVLRLARPEEHEALDGLMRRASLALDDYRESLEANPDAFDLPASQIEQGQVVVAEVDGKPAGFASVVEGEIDGLFVEPALWRRGIGAALVEEATQMARRRGLSMMVVANPAARVFYEKCGFSVEGDEKTRFGPAFRMSR